MGGSSLFDYTGKSCDHKYCGDGDITFLICLVNICVKGFVNLKPVTVSHHLAMFGIHWSSASRDIYRCTNTDLKIYRCLCLHMNIIC